MRAYKSSLLSRGVSGLLDILKTLADMVTCYSGWGMLK